MKTIGVRQLKNEATKVIREVREHGTEYVVTVNGEPVATVMPYVPPKRVPNEALLAWLEKKQKLAADIGEHWHTKLSAVEAVREQRR